MTVPLENPTEDTKTSIQMFYSGQNIFVTGATGFLGMALIEKLLRTCSDVGTIYILVRPKKNKTAEERANKIFENPVFEQVKKQMPNFQDKIITMTGDTSLPDLGLSQKDKDILIREINIVFNVAATVKFNASMKYAVTTNVKSVLEILLMCKSMNNLKVVMHVSTAYSNCTLKDISEQFYEPPLDGKAALSVTTFSDDAMNAITKYLLGKFPNTYVFTKCIAEQVVQEYGQGLPRGVFRPAVVAPSYEEPMQGWCLGVTGFERLMCGIGLGFIRIALQDPTKHTAIVPIDMTINALLSTATDAAQSAEPSVYNYTLPGKDSISQERLINIGSKHAREVGPSICAVWYLSCMTTKSVVLFTLLSLLLHTLPALLIDFVLLLMCKKPRVFKIQKAAYTGCLALGYFSTRQFNFSNRNTRNVWKNLSKTDQELFPFYMDNFDWNIYLGRCCDGLRRYVVKDDPSTIPQAKTRMARLRVLHRTVQCLFVMLITWLAYSIIEKTLWVKI